jgi:hypothetical protein
MRNIYCQPKRRASDGSDIGLCPAYHCCDTMSKWLSAVRRIVELQAGRFIAGSGNFRYVHLTGFNEVHWVLSRYVQLAECSEVHWVPFRYVHLAECREVH